MYRTFYLSLMLISGLLLFVYMLFAAHREVEPEWKKYQTEYKDLLIKTAKDESTKRKARSLDLGMQQIYLTDLKRVDRCTVCHMGVENPLMANAKEILFKQHSGDYLKDHPADTYGCTICHNGQGRATNTKEAHGDALDAHWDYPIIPPKYIQSTCAQCHDYEMLKQNGGEVIVKGKTLFMEKGCMGCHKLNGVGGVLGKSLDEIGSQPFAYFPMRYVEGKKTIYAWQKQHLDDPRNIVPDSEMKLDIKDTDSDPLTTYVLTLKPQEPPRKYRRIRQTLGQEEAVDGMSLYKLYCIACHTTGKQSIYDEIFMRTIPAVMNPAFLKAADNKFIKKAIGEGRTDTQMTAWKAEGAGLTDKEIDEIIKYVTRDRPEERSEPFVFSEFKGDTRKGEELYKVRCKLCHGDKGKGGMDLLGINLKNPVVQKEADPEFLAITVRDGRETTPMVAFGKKGLGLGDQDIADVVAYVRTLAAKE
jgi:mono/diheme cytochrome c family protein